MGERLHATAGELVLELALLLPSGTDLNKHKLGEKLLAYTGAVAKEAIEKALNLPKWHQSGSAPPNGFYWLWDVYNDEWLVVRVEQIEEGLCRIYVPGSDDPPRWTDLPHGTVLAGPLVSPPDWKPNGF
jgi:hypothetical protein